MAPRHLALAALLATSACGFTVPAGGGSGDDVEPNPEPPAAAARKCATGDPALRLCIDFDDDQTLTSDGSGRGHDAIGISYTVTPRASEQAIMVDSTTQLVVAETPDLDITNNLTVTLMAQPTSYPQGGAAYWAIDNNKQYFISYQRDGKFRCGIGTTTVDAAVGVPKDAWYHVACTFDHGQLKLFVQGQLAGCRTMPNTIPINGSEGLAIGGNIGVGNVFSDQFIGGLDNIQVFARTLSMDEVCSAAGKSGCWKTCVQ